MDLKSSVAGLEILDEHNIAVRASEDRKARLREEAEAAHAEKLRKEHATLAMKLIFQI